MLTYIVFLFIYIVSQCEAGDYCITRRRVEYCDYGCCHVNDDDYYYKCCEVNLRLILGLVFGIGAFITAIVAIVICWCRRRRYGVVYRNGQRPQAGVIIHTTNNGVVNTSTIPPGMAYPPPVYQAPPYPGPPAPIPPYAAAPPPEVKHADGPPAYSDVVTGP